MGEEHEQRPLEGPSTVLDQALGHRLQDHADVPLGSGAYVLPLLQTGPLADEDVVLDVLDEEDALPLQPPGFGP